MKTIAASLLLAAAASASAVEPVISGPRVSDPVAPRSSQAPGATLPPVHLTDIRGRIIARSDFLSGVEAALRAGGSSARDMRITNLQTAPCYAEWVEMGDVLTGSCVFRVSAWQTAASLVVTLDAGDKLTVQPLHVTIE